MLAERDGVLANLGRADQQLERAAEPAALAGDDLVVDPLLRRVHLGGGNLAITAHGSAPVSSRPAHHSAIRLRFSVIDDR